MVDETVIIKCKGLNNSLLNENHFKELLAGKNVLFTLIPKKYLLI
jgi:hypothetical protein